MSFEQELIKLFEYEIFVFLKHPVYCGKKLWNE